jgi:hypothetical protein
MSKQSSTKNLYFENGQYQETSISPTFPNLFLIEMIPLWVQQAIEQGTSQMLRELKNQLS